MSPAPGVGRRSHSLSGRWDVVSVDGSTGPVAATVPGSVHTDLLRAGLIPDPFEAMNEHDVGWVSETDWVYSCRFKLDDRGHDEQVELVCDGLNTFAELRLNDHVIGASESMHVAYRFDISQALLPGENELSIRFEAPMSSVRRLVDEHGELPHAGHGANRPIAYNAVRTMACAFGWDWGPVLPSVGIWRDIRVERWRAARLGQVRPLVVHADPDVARVEIHPDITRCAEVGCEVSAELRDPSDVLVASTRWTDGPGELTVDSPQLWWPAGHGDQPLYELQVQLRSDGAVLDQYRATIGLRSVELVTTPDVGEHALGCGSTFHLRINGRRIFAKGANWIPDSPFPGIITSERYRERIEQAHQANMNMLRVWGGGLYESHEFYSLCDELGILVWQDFLCACAAYHEHEPYHSWFNAEARDNVARLSAHPSLVLWCGNNECQEAVAHWGDEFQRLTREGVPWGDSYYRALFPEALGDLDPTRPYWPGSPYTHEFPGEPRRAESGDQHIWDVWNGEGDARRYMLHAPRFASEFGFHGPPTWKTIESAIPADERYFDSPAMVHHNKHAGGQALANTRLADYFEPPGAFDDWLYLAQVVQARSLEIGCAWFRALSPWCSGALYWQLNDIWPVSSWAAIDSSGRPKPLWYATRRFFRPRLVTIRPTRPLSTIDEVDQLSVYLHNDHPDPWDATVVVEDRDLNGAIRSELAREHLQIAPGDLASVALPAGHRPSGLLLASVGDERAHWFTLPDRLLEYPEPSLEFELDRSGEDHRLTLKARSLVRDLCIFPERLDPDARISDQLLTLLPGDEVQIMISSPTPLPVDELTRAPVLQTANRFGANSQHHG